MTRRIQSAKEIPLTDINISSLDIAICTIILDTKKYIVNPVEGTIQKMSKEVRSSIHIKETIILSLHYNITIWNASNVITMDMKPINVYFQSMSKR
jgi:hypothetical protein